MSSSSSMIQGVQGNTPPPPTTTLQELVLAGHFKVPLALGIMDIADWASQFRDYPIPQEAPTLAPASMPTEGFQIPSIQFGSGIEVPRMLLRSPDGRFSLQLQGDRFGFGWARIEPVGSPAAYPGFEVMLGMWTELSSRFEAWAEGRFRSRPQYRLAEVTYVNAAPLDSGDGKRRRISEIFRFVSPGMRPVNMFNVQWAERLNSSESPDPFTGIIHSTVAFGQAPPAIPVLGFNFNGTALVADGVKCEHIMRHIHAKIREIYQSAIIIDAN